MRVVFTQAALKDLDDITSRPISQRSLTHSKDAFKQSPHA